MELLTITARDDKLTD